LASGVLAHSEAVVVRRLLHKPFVGKRVFILNGLY
jgi:hypothetical protein